MHTDSLAPSIITNLPSITLQLFDAENYTAWPPSARIRINTSTSGAAITEDIFNFPLLVRLDTLAPGFAFSENGNDLRFASLNGNPLRYQIDWRDTSRNQAGICRLRDGVQADFSKIIHKGKLDARPWPSYSLEFRVQDYEVGFQLAKNDLNSKKVLSQDSLRSGE